jgi:hypothetical protein
MTARISILISIFCVFSKLQKSTVSSVMLVGLSIARPSVFLSFRMKQRRSD